MARVVSHAAADRPPERPSSHGYPFSFRYKSGPGGLGTPLAACGFPGAFRAFRRRGGVAGAQAPQ